MLGRSIPLALIALSSSVAALAQTDGEPRIEEIIVTAQKREQSLQDVPISVTAFTADDIAQSQIRGVSDYVALTPNISFPESGEIGFSQIIIRGLQNFGGEVNAFGVYVDEFSLAPSGLQITVDPQLQDIERLEVLRGPQGVAFGRNVIAGAVNITTKKPGDTFEGELIADYGRYDTHMVKAAVSGPVVDGALGLRLVGFHEQTDGFIDDIGPGGNTNDAKNYGGRAALRFTGIEGLTADASVTLSRRSRGLPSAVPGPHLPPDSLLFGPFFGAAPPVDAGEGRWPHNRNRVSTNFPTRQAIDTDVYQLRINYDLGAMSLVSVTGRIEADYDYLGEADMTAADYTYIDEVMSLDSFSQELRLQSNGEGRLNWLLGAIYSSDESATLESFGGGVDGWAGVNDIVRFVANPSRAVAGLPPLPLFPLAPAKLNTFGGSSDTTSYAAFAEIDYAATERLSLTAGLRYTHDTVRTDFRRFGDFSPPGLLAGELVPFDFVGAGETKYDAVTPRVTATFAINDDANVYAAVSQGYKSGGFNAEAAAFAADVAGFDFTYDPERAWSYEVGLKITLLDDRLRVNASVFHVDWKDVQVAAFDLETLSSLTQNAAKATARGAELEVAARPVRSLTISAAAGYLDATVDEFANAIVDGDITDLSGHRLPYAPEWSFGGRAHYETALPFVADTLGFTRLEVSYRSRQYDDLANRDRDRLPSYSLWNLRTGFERGPVRVAAYVENLFESDYHLSPSDVQGRLPLSGDLVDVHPRIYGIELVYRYQ